MFDIKTLKASPGLARRLIAFSEINSLSFDEKLADLALQGLITRDQLKTFPYTLDGRQMSALQFVADWNGRALLLGDCVDKLRITALANAWLDGSNLLILSQPDAYVEWAQLVNQVWPNAKVSVFGNQRYFPPVQRSQLPPGCQFSTEPDYDAQVFITSYGGVIWNNFLGKADFGQTIVEEMANPGTISYKWESAVKGMARELPRPLYLQPLMSNLTDSTMDIHAALHVTGSRILNHISMLLRDYVRAGVPHRLNLLTDTNAAQSAVNYLNHRGYKNIDFLKLSNIFGISSHLVDVDPLFFYDESITKVVNFKPSKQSQHSLYRIKTNEHQMLLKSGRSLSDTVRLALQGNDVMATLVGDLMDSQWATLKASHMKTFAPSLSGGMAKILYLTDNKTLTASLKLQLGIRAGALSDAFDVDATRRSFLNKDAQNILPISHLVVNREQFLDSELLNMANYVVVGDACLDTDEFHDLKSLAMHYDFKIIIPIVRDTWEEEIYKQLI